MQRPSTSSHLWFSSSGCRALTFAPPLSLSPLLLIHRQVKDDTEALQRAEMDSRGTEKHDAIDQLLGNFHVTRRAGKERNKNGASSSAGTSANGSPGPAAAASPQNRDLKAQAAAVFQQRFVEPDGGAGFKDIPDDMSVGPDSEVRQFGPVLTLHLTTRAHPPRFPLRCALPFLRTPPLCSRSPLSPGMT